MTKTTYYIPARDKKGRFARTKRKAFWFVVLAGVYFGSLGFFVSNPVVALEYQIKEVMVPVETDAEFPPILYKICTCESGQGTGKPQHFDQKTGKVLRGYATPNDVGACQINTDAEVTNWFDVARDMGLDVYKEEDNYKMARWIFENHGTWPWDSSRSCWK